ADIFLWKNKKVTAGVLGFATLIWVLFELVEYHLLTLVCHTLIAALAVLFLWSNAASFINKSPPKFPEVALPEDIVLGVANALRVEVNKALKDSKLQSLWKRFEEISPAEGLILHCWNFLTLFYTIFVLLHTVPYLYDKYEDKVDAFGEKAEAEIKKQYAVFSVKKQYAQIK
ncbi:reticulon-like protein B2, partial [Tanacetum coccineum]